MECYNSSVYNYTIEGKDSQHMLADGFGLKYVWLGPIILDWLMSILLLIVLGCIIYVLNLAWVKCSKKNVLWPANWMTKRQMVLSTLFIQLWWITWETFDTSEPPAWNSRKKIKYISSITIFWCKKFISGVSYLNMADDSHHVAGISAVTQQGVWNCSTCSDLLAIWLQDFQSGDKLHLAITDKWTLWGQKSVL